MLNISILSVFPELYKAFLETSLIKRAEQKGIVRYHLDTFFSFVQPKERIDAPTFGAGAGMLIRPEVVERCVEQKEQQWGKSFKIFFSPHGKKLEQPLLADLAKQIASYEHIMLFASRYEGMDTRVEEEYADALISVGDFVLMAGDVPVMMLLEGLLRLLPGVVGKQESIEKESFSGPFVDFPSYTAPVVWKGRTVPEVVRSGNHGAVQQWRLEQAVTRTVHQHFEWLQASKVPAAQKELVLQAIPPHYVALLHEHVLLPQGQVGTTSVTSLDIHDIARSAATLGCKGYFIVTPLQDQQLIVSRLIDFWQKGEGVGYNEHRHQALKNVALVSHIEEVLETIERVHDQKPLLIATSAQISDHSTLACKYITYHDQAKVWQLSRPVLFLFGTGHGLAPSILEKADFILVPLEGFTQFNHLSVRSAVAVILDRWLGNNPKAV